MQVEVEALTQHPVVVVDSILEVVPLEAEEVDLEEAVEAEEEEDLIVFLKEKDLQLKL
jgi:hypothetical protein